MQYTVVNIVQIQYLFDRYCDISINRFILTTLLIKVYKISCIISDIFYFWNNQIPTRICFLDESLKKIHSLGQKISWVQEFVI